MTGVDATRARRFERLFADCHVDVLRYCVRRSETFEDGEEATTETFAVAWRRLDDIRPPTLPCGRRSTRCVRSTASCCS